jgi:hypothetical protein
MQRARAEDAPALTGLGAALVARRRAPSSLRDAARGHTRVVPAALAVVRATRDRRGRSRVRRRWARLRERVGDASRDERGEREERTSFHRGRVYDWAVFAAALRARCALPNGSPHQLSGLDRGACAAPGG